MEIEVRDCDEVIFSGLAEDFLYNMNNDVELEIALDYLESEPFGTVANFYELEIEKLETSLFD